MPHPAAFHVRHITGVIDRLFTYARGEALSAEQFASLRAEIPTLILAPLVRFDSDAAQIWHQPEHLAAAKTYAEAAGNVRDLVTEWFGAPRAPAVLIELPDAQWSSFESGAMLLTGLRQASPRELQTADHV